MTCLALLLLVALPQFPRPSEIGAPQRAAAGALRLPRGSVVTRLLVPGDVDGDAADDLLLARVGMRMCGNEPCDGALDVLAAGRYPLRKVEGLRGRPILDLGRFDGVPRLLVLCAEPWGGTPHVELRSLDGRTRLWTLDAGELPFDGLFEGCVLPALVPEASDDVIVANAWATPSRERDGVADCGVVARLSGVDGSTLWVHWAHTSAQAYGRHVAPAGDVDGDGVNDVVVCVPDLRPAQPRPELRRPFLEFLSGADGSILGKRPLEPANVQQFRAVGDLDGDGRADFIVQTSEPARGEGQPTAMLLSSNPESVPVLPDHEVLWFTPWTTADGEAAVLVGVRDRSSDARSLQRVTAAGVRRFADYPQALESGVDHVAQGDFDGDGLADLALVLRGSNRGFDLRQELVLLPGYTLR